MGRKKTTASDAAAMKLQILETAENLFRQIGYAKTTVTDIAKALGMSQANIYRYFPSKAGINEAICERVVHQIEAQSWEALVQDGTSTERLKRFIKEYHRTVKNSIIKEKRLYDMVAVAMDEHWSVIQGHSARVRDLLKIIIEQGMSSGEFRRVNSDNMAKALNGSLAVFIYPKLLEHEINDEERGGDHDRLDADLDQLLDLVLNGLCSGEK
ncbi:TetR/AcrR family transcriptional regulator [Solidesulfovibrio carbinolicus]|uniref:TetR/AcrR family transcriptional regulator n=1 Tax=Solidesulfovibrio carbinolicus TaxID=296842 RepID=A0A4P6HNJ2_9BACT|nr:TetR/AcrR family transcriptional regulator [Solidesulfovibrio carbinolicus]QAZ68813.1 TetR/AcrR family transcriptional regulator [Solidesulfovibrio carbinolicus]